MELSEFITARLDEDEALVYREGTPPNGVIAWLTYLQPDGSMGYTTVAHGDGNGGPWIADGKVLPEPASVLVVHDPARVLHMIKAKRAIVGQQISDHAPIESIYGTVCRTCVDWQDDDGAHEFGIAIPHPWPCRVARSAAAAWPDHADYRAAWALD